VYCVHIQCTMLLLNSVNLVFHISVVFITNSFLELVSLTVVLSPLIWNPTSHNNKIAFCIAERLF
jgi:hypothetical protein